MQIHQVIQMIGKCIKPSSLTKLEESGINTMEIGFRIDYDYPWHTTPIDVIPFAATGGDACHFGFITDFGKTLDLDKAPIVFCSPTDYDEQRPQYGNILFAKNFIDFLSIMTQITYAEIIRFENPRQFDYQKAIKEIKSERLENETITQMEVIGQISSIINLNNIVDYHNYYNELYEMRSTDKFVKTKDEINILCETSPAEIQELKNDLEPDELDMWLESVNRISRLKFYRDINTIYGGHIYDDIASVVVKHLEEDKLNYEAKFMIRKMN